VKLIVSPLAMTDNFKESLSNQPIIIDNGTGIMKVQAATETTTTTPLRVHSDIILCTQPDWLTD
jgi:hypothetical protein